MSSRPAYRVESKSVQVSKSEREVKGKRTGPALNGKPKSDRAGASSSTKQTVWQAPSSRSQHVAS